MAQSIEESAGPSELEIPVPASIRRIADIENRKLAWQFFVFFCRFEYALKRTPPFLIGSAARAAAAWDRFASTHDQAFALLDSDELRRAVDYFVASPPRKQVVRSRRLAWSEPQYYRDGPKLVWLLLMVRSVRNNLFHGGKFPARPAQEPSRDSELLLRSITILNACLLLDPDVAQWFEEWI